MFETGYFLTKDGTKVEPRKGRKAAQTCSLELFLQ